LKVWDRDEGPFGLSGDPLKIKLVDLLIDDPDLVMLKVI